MRNGFSQTQIHRSTITTVAIGPVSFHDCFLVSQSVFPHVLTSTIPKNARGSKELIDIVDSPCDLFALIVALVNETFFQISWLPVDGLSSTRRMRTGRSPVSMRSRSMARIPLKCTCFLEMR